MPIAGAASPEAVLNSFPVLVVVLVGGLMPFTRVERTFMDTV